MRVISPPSLPIQALRQLPLRLRVKTERKAATRSTSINTMERLLLPSQRDSLLTTSLISPQMVIKLPQLVNPQPQPHLRQILPKTFSMSSPQTCHQSLQQEMKLTIKWTHCPTFSLRAVNPWPPRCKTSPRTTNTASSTLCTSSSPLVVPSSHSQTSSKLRACLARTRSLS